MQTIITYSFRIKDSSSGKKLSKMASAVNFVWNYCNEYSHKSISHNSKWLSSFDLHKLTAGCSKMLNLQASTIAAICDEYVSKKIKSKKVKLSWRSYKKSLGWIPLKSKTYSIKGDVINYYGHQFKFWKSREITGILKTASFSQDAKGRWYINIQVEVEKYTLEKTGSNIGIDLGLKTIATDSNGVKYERGSLTKKYEQKLAMAQRARKKKLVKTIYSKIRNSRKDWSHKTTTQIIKENEVIIVGNVSSVKLKKTKMAKSVSDVSWFQFKSLLAYKAIRFGREYKEVNESFSSVTCSSCLNKTGPSGLSSLGVREWTCNVCGTIHDRDVNAAKNIFRIGYNAPKGVLIREDTNCQ